MANAFNNVNDAAGILAKAAAKMFADKCQFLKSIATADSSDYDGKNGYSAGDTIYISKPARFIPQSTLDITSSIQDVVEEKVALPLDTTSTVGVELGSLQEATDFKLKAMAKRVIEPAVSSIVQDVEQRLLLKATQATFNTIGTAGSTVFDTDTMLAARERLNKNLCPKDNSRFALLDSSAMRSAVNSRKGLFQSASAIDDQYKMGYMGQSEGFTYLENELLYNHTNGTDVTFEVRTTVSAEGATSLVVEGLTANTGTVTKGTTFTINTVYAVHPITKETLTFLQPFTVTANATADASGYATLSISPAIYTSASNGLQNVSAFPADGDTINVLTGSASSGYTQNLVFHKNAFRKVFVPMIMPQKAEFAAQETVDGITVQIIRDWDNLERKMVTRLDVLCGLVADRPEWACRITS